ncbi:MAG: mechanosensitive ion channel [Acidobacteria bacterium]|nr:mechanosensitive ion channel [Acidobacteriota bacterium]NIM60747.1 mechanosensitive ion channel [Acidobacteriota bacterium]NIO57960.1 mechanosensitive ion channel [Acidobacteriota bacterium]NIQ28965.1 mechanosensitive ion channel [Acidobacteriota bacterium]NIQ83437.1 mechanosensitive ion channel [Acidobacteriota bacterium]
MEEFSAFVQQAWAEPWLRAGMTVIGAVIVAKVTEIVFSRILVRLTVKTDTDLDDKLIELLRRPVFVTVVCVGLYSAISMVDLNAGIRNNLRSLVHTVLIIVWLFSSTKIVHTLLEVFSRLADRVTWIEARTAPLLDNVARLLLFGGAVYFLLIAWDLNVAPWLASAGIAGIAIGFAAKDSLANLFGGLFVIMDAPYKIGDYINLDSGERGKVIKIGLRSTRLLTRDDIEVTVPNGVIANAKVVNESGGPWQKRRVVVTVGVAYGSDVRQVSDLLMSAAERVDWIVSDPPPRIRFTEMGDSALIFRVLGWIREPELRGRAIDALNTAIYEDLNAAGIEIPFPQRTVHHVGFPGAETRGGAG